MYRDFLLTALQCTEQICVPLDENRNVTTALAKKSEWRKNVGSFRLSSGTKVRFVQPV